MKNRAKAGLTLVEMLCTVIIVLLFSVGLVNGMSLAVKSYQQSLMSSESQILVSTLTSIVSDELRYSGTVTAPAEGEGTVSFFSRTYGEDSAFSQNGDGQVLLKGNKLLPSKAYHYGMQASVKLTVPEKNVFHVVIEITSASGNSLAKSEFDVERLNVGNQRDGT